MQNNFIKSKEEKQLCHRQHQEQPQECNEIQRACPAAWAAERGRNRGGADGPTGLKLGGGDRKGREERGESRRMKK